MCMAGFWPKSGDGFACPQRADHWTPKGPPVGNNIKMEEEGEDFFAEYKEELA